MMNESFSSIFIRNKGLFFSFMSVLVFSATALGVQRTVLSIYTGQLDSSLTSFFILSAALALSSFGGAKALGNYLGGRLSEGYGRNKTVRLGIILLIIGSILLVITNRLEVFFTGNSFVGLGIGTIFASSTVALSDIAPSSHRAKAISLMELSVYSGTALGSFLAGIISNLDYIYSFVLALGIVIVSFFFGLMLKNTAKLAEDEEQSVLPSFTKRILGIRSEVEPIFEKYADEENKVKEMAKYTDLLDTIRKEYAEIKRSSTAPPSVRIYLTPSFLLIFASGIMSRIADTAMILIFPLLILQNNSFDLTTLGVLTSLFTVFWALGIAITGPIADRIGRKFPLFFGLIIEALGYLLIFFIGLSNFLPMVFFGTMMAGSGRGLYFPLPASLASEHVPLHYKARTLGIYRLILDLGYVIGSVLLVLLIEPRFLANPSISISSLLEPIFQIVIVLLVIVGLLNVFVLKDPRPGFRQYEEVREHMKLISKSVSHCIEYIGDYTDGKPNSDHIVEAKNFERKADTLLEYMTIRTYSGAVKAPDATEILRLSTLIDKVAGHGIRSVRKLHLIQETISHQFMMRLQLYGSILDVLMHTALETIELLPVRINLAAIHSYQVSFVEEILDVIHQELWMEINRQAHDLGPLTVLLLTQAIEGLEKGANALDDAIEQIRLISFKHTI